MNTSVPFCTNVSRPASNSVARRGSLDAKVASYASGYTYSRR